MKIYHNPRCRKSRETLALIREAGQEPEIIEYLKNPPTAAELQEILDMMSLSASALLRKGEAIYKEKFKGQEHSDAEWIQIMVENPKLIERPIVVSKGEAVVGRPPENVKDLL